MKIKIPKKAVYIILIIGLIGRAFLIGAKRNTKSQFSIPGQEGSRVDNQQIQEIEVTAKQFEFTPNPLRVKLGETVRLRITSVDVTHGFSLPEFGINEVLEPGETVTVEFQATKKGKFPFACSVACGIGHASMRGTLIVE